MRFEIRQLDAWENEDGMWYWNNSYKIGEFVTHWKDEKRAFLYNLHKMGIMFRRGKTTVICENDIYEVQERKTGKPLFAALPIEEEIS